MRGEYKIRTIKVVVAWNYLRVRGEYAAAFRSKTAALELPPCTRRIHKATICEPPNDGTTSAYAENTREHVAIHRGIQELPPRTRRILLAPGAEVPAGGTTSAYAENTAFGAKLIA